MLVLGILETPNVGLSFSMVPFLGVVKGWQEENNTFFGGEPLKPDTPKSRISRAPIFPRQHPLFDPFKVSFPWQADVWRSMGSSLISWVRMSPRFTSRRCDLTHRRGFWSAPRLLTPMKNPEPAGALENNPC